jgi:superfamily II RNA helicase
MATLVVKTVVDEVLLVILDLVVTGLVQRLVNLAVEEVMQCQKASNDLPNEVASFGATFIKNYRIVDYAKTTVT